MRDEDIERLLLFEKTPEARWFRDLVRQRLKKKPTETEKDAHADTTK